MTKNEFAKLKVGDKVIIKKYTKRSRYNGASWVDDMDVFIGLTCTISYIDYELNFFHISEDEDGFYFDRNAVQEVVTDFVEKHEQTPEERIKQLEDEIKTLKKEQKRSEEFEKMKKAGSEINASIEGLMAGGLSREEAFELVKTMAAGFAKNPLSGLI